ncbi:LPS-assembly protein LptD [Desulfoluna spongiiphila]|uniref:LPS-assembly protein n=1 Tax=Desulfoluna spongiiphila TaxID=419481 RepID=A0A1G5H2C7_9BACT|nr:LPS assembly protein LptD [Desulfoluna spongiiphila]SCY57817.1 LPS-assembly protein [Desulfoluna spongiiphila]VVS94736.1 lps-assembly protein lptd [Desulfoluna spongiiphila]
MVFPHRFTWFLLLSILLFTVTPASAAPTSGQSPVNITADSLAHDAAKGVYIAEGNVLVTDGAVTLVADHVTYHIQDGTAEAEGNVRLTSEEDVVTADTVTYAMESKEGTITNGTVFIKSRNLWIRGETLEKRGENRYTAERVTVTTCDGENPDWAITGRKFDITVEGYGTAHHVMLKTAGVPVVYTPFLLFPVKIKRQTGLLAPLVGYSSRKGLDIIQPLFVTLGDSMDATVYANHMTERGTRGGVEFRYMASALSKGIFSAEGLNDRKIDDGTSENSDYGYDGSPDRTNTDRYWFRGKADQELPGGFKAKLDLDWVSDQDYLREFKDGPGGFDATQDDMEEYMGRTIEDHTDTVRTNKLSVSKTTNAFTASLSGIWNDDVVARSQDTEDSTLQQLPSLTVSQSRSALGTSPFQMSMTGGATSFYRQDLTSSLYDGERTYILPKVYMPFKVGAFSVDPSAGVRGLWWDIDTEDSASAFSGTHSTAVPEFTTDISTEFYKIFNTDADWADKARHRLKPTLTYDWQERLDDTEYPTFDTVDELDGKNQITLKLDSILTSKKNGESLPVYRDLLTATISQTWDIQEDRETDPSQWRNGLTKEPFRPFYAELIFNPVMNLYFKFDGTWSWYESEMLTQNSALILGTEETKLFSISHRKKRDPLESIHESLGIPASSSYESTDSLVARLKMDIFDRITLDCDYERDLEESEDIKKSVGLTYTSSCWALFTRYEDSTDDTKIVFGVELTGLGGFDSSYDAN